MLSLELTLLLPSTRAGMVVVPKPNGTIRICVDLKPLPSPMSIKIPTLIDAI